MKIRFFIDISSRCIKNLIGLFNSDKLLIFKFGNLKFDLKDNFVNNLKKLECLQIAKFLCFEMI